MRNAYLRKKRNMMHFLCMAIGDFFSLANAHPWAYIAITINLGVVFVNGWTDGPNSIATAVITRAITPKKAITMCAILNALGVIFIGALAEEQIKQAFIQSEKEVNDLHIRISQRMR